VKKGRNKPLQGHAPSQDPEKKKRRIENAFDMKADHGEPRDEESNALAIAIRRGRARTRSNRTPSHQTRAAESCVGSPIYNK
jgi:hypothetical protein